MWTVLRQLIFFTAVISLRPVAASDALDYEYRLESIGYLRSSDNLARASETPVRRAFRNYFSTQARFSSVDISEHDEILLKAKTPYDQMIDDPDVLSDLARVSGVQSLIKTRLTNAHGRYQLRLDWFLAPKILPLVSETLVLRVTDSLDSSDVQTQIQAAIASLIKKLPWFAHVTSKNTMSMTINAGSDKGLNVGDRIKIATLKRVVRRPPPKASVEWVLSRTGVVELENVDGHRASGRIIYEFKPSSVERLQKVTGVFHAQEVEFLGGDDVIVTTDDEDPYAKEPRPPTLVAPATDPWQRSWKIIPPENQEEPKPQEIPHSSEEKTNTANPSPPRPRPPSFLGLGLWLGALMSDYHDVGGHVWTGGGPLFGLKLGGRIWLIPELFTDVDAGFSLISYSHGSEGSSTTTSSGSATLLLLRAAAGYAFWLGDVSKSADIFAKVGYHSFAFSIPSASGQPGGAIDFTSVFAAAGITVPIDERSTIEGAFDLGLINGASDEGQSATSASAWNLELDGRYLMSKQWLLRLRAEYDYNEAHDVPSAPTHENVLSICPSIAYVF